MKILATGAAGMVGSHLLDVHQADAIHRTDLRDDVASGIHPLDIRDRAAVEDALERVRPDLVLHLAAETNVDLCEQRPDQAFLTNVIGTQNVAQACNRLGIELVYVSTAGVFDGTRPEPYTEFDRPAPVSVYGRSKLEGEEAVKQLTTRHYIVRAGWIFGGLSGDHKFVGKIASLIDKEDQIKVVDDKFGNPTYAIDLLKNIDVLTRAGHYGLYHCVGTGSCSRFDVAAEVARFLGKDIKMIPISSAEFPLPAPRPRSEAARNYKLDLMGLNHMRPWKEALHDYLGSWTRRA